MTETDNYSKAKQIKTLLAVFGSGIIGAIVLSIVTIYYYNPTGAYRAENVLLTPENAFQLSFSEMEGKSKKQYVFDRLTFSYYDPISKQKKVVSIDQEDYAKFYALVENETSIADSNEEVVQNAFNQSHAASLVLMIRNKNESGHAIMFSEVDFADNGDYYRVRLRQQGINHDEWAYYRHPGIYGKVVKIFDL